MATQDYFPVPAADRQQTLIASLQSLPAGAVTDTVVACGEVTLITTRERLIEVLSRARFETDDARCRLALDRPVGNRGDLLAGGERQRLAIARALLNAPVLLLMDEPVAHLDAVNRLRVKETIAALPRSVTVLFTSHDGTLHDLADQTIDLAAVRGAG